MTKDINNLKICRWCFSKLERYPAGDRGFEICYRCSRCGRLYWQRIIPEKAGAKA